MLEPGTPYPDFWRWIGAAFALLVAGSLVGWWAEVWDQPRVSFFEENGPLETVQAVALGLAAILFAIRAWRADGVLADISVVLVFLLVFSMIREMPRCDSYYYYGGVCLQANVKTWLIGAAAAAAAAVLILRRANPIDMLRPRWTLVFWPLWAALVLLGLAEATEQFKWIALEETLETAAYAYACATAAWIVRRA